MKYKTRRNTQLPKKETIGQPVTIPKDLCQEQQQEQRGETIPEPFDLESGIGLTRPGSWLEQMARPQHDDDFGIAGDIEDIAQELEDCYE